MTGEKILIVDDEPKIRRLLSINLSSLNYETACAVDGKSALALVDAFAPDLVLLDVMMPSMDGFEVLQTIRAKSSVGVILLTARDQIEDKIRGFDLGADDYLAKPFALEELFGRVAAVLRRSRRSAAPEPEARTIENGPLSLVAAEHRAACFGRELRLTVNEFNLLHYFTAHVGSVITHEQLFAHVWGSDRDCDVQVIRVTLARLRQKLRDAGLEGDCGIESHSGVGYRMRALAQ